MASSNTKHKTTSKEWWKQQDKKEEEWRRIEMKVRRVRSNEISDQDPPPAFNSHRVSNSHRFFEFLQYTTKQNYFLSHVIFTHSRYL